MASPLFALPPLPPRRFTETPASTSPPPSPTTLPANARVSGVFGPKVASAGDPAAAAATRPFARGREVAALLLWTAALFVALALASYEGDPTPPPEGIAELHGADWVGPVGAWCARAIATTIGVIGWSIPV